MKESRKRCSVNLGRWMSYAAAGAATALVASNDAEATIYYSGTIDLAVSNGHAAKMSTLHSHGRGLPPGPGSYSIGTFVDGFNGANGRRKAGTEPFSGRKGRGISCHVAQRRQVQLRIQAGDGREHRRPEFSRLQRLAHMRIWPMAASIATANSIMRERDSWPSSSIWAVASNTAGRG